MKKLQLSISKGVQLSWTGFTGSIERERAFDHAVYETAYSVELLVRLEHQECMKVSCG